jgi:enamine deaminase RidA (YjgF/YER057c/UK114 family)
MSNRLRISTGTPWEAAVGYSRAIRVGNMVWTAGTTATDNEGNLVGPGDPYLQMRQCLLRIQAALAQAGARLEDVVRVEIWVTDISQWQEIGRAHAEFFGEIRPTNFMVEVSSLVSPEMLVEVAAIAVIDEGGA